MTKTPVYDDRGRRIGFLLRYPGGEQSVCFEREADATAEQVLSSVQREELPEEEEQQQS